MEHFRVLPTDHRVQQLSDLHIKLLMQYWLDYDEGYSRKVYRDQQAAERNKPHFDRQALYDMGYTDEMIDCDPVLRGE